MSENVTVPAWVLGDLDRTIGVCAAHGGAVSVRRSLVLATRPTRPGPLSLLLGSVGVVLVMVGVDRHEHLIQGLGTMCVTGAVTPVMQSRQTSSVDDWPFCSRCQGGASVGRLVGWGGLLVVLLAVVGFITCLSHPQALLAWLAVAGLGALLGVAGASAASLSTHVHAGLIRDGGGDGMVRRAHPRFVEAVQRAQNGGPGPWVTRSTR